MLESLKAQYFCNTTSKSISESLLSLFKKRRTVRQFKSAEINIEVIKNAIAIANTAPSGANKQPWSFAIIEDQNIKNKIKQWAESEEKIFYQQKAPKKWLKDLKPLHTDDQKIFLSEASYLVPIFYNSFDIDYTGQKKSNYYVKESVGIATGLLISALHLSGLSILTYTPSNRKELTTLLSRELNENTFMILAIGLPSINAQVPTLSKKTLDEILQIYHEVPERNQATTL